MRQSASERELAYRPDIDGLRGIAVGSVVAYHAFPNFVKGGFAGVDVFFVISGFLISRIILEALEQGRFSYLDFYNRRIRRIFPALALVSAATLLFGWYALLPDEFQRLGKHLASGAAFISNFALWRESGYFDVAADSKPLLHLWSLAIEEQFYIVWPLMLGLVWRRKRGFLIVTLVVGAVSFAVNILTVFHNPEAAFYSPLSRAWELMMGGVLAYVTMHRADLLRRYPSAQAWTGVSLIAAGVWLLNRESAFPGYWALLPTVGTFLVVSGGSNCWVNRRILAARPLVWLGLISYPLYLWHWPILVFWKVVKGFVLAPAELIGAIAASVLLAYLTYQLVEKPLRRVRSFAVPAALAGSMAAIAAVGLFALGDRFPPRLKTENVSQIVSASYDWEYPPVASNLHLAGPLRYFVEANGPAYTLFVGDSNMEQYAPRIDRVIQNHPLKTNGAILVGNQRECELLKELFTGEHTCDPTIASLEGLIDRQSTKTITLAASWLRYKNEILDGQNQKRFGKFLRSAASGRRVYLILNIPSGQEVAPANMFAGSRLTRITAKPVTGLHFDMETFDRRFGAVNQILRKLAAESGALIIDPVAQLCPQRQCPLFDESGKPLYLDSTHLTRSYALSSAVYIDATLRDQ